MDVGVDEARDDVKAGRVDDLGCGRVAEVADLEDHPVEHRDSARKAGPPVPSITQPPFKIRSYLHGSLAGEKGRRP